MWPVVLWWLVLEGLGLIALPLLFGLFSERSGHGYPFAKVATVLLLTYFSWLGGYVMAMPLAVNATLGVLVAASLAMAFWQRSEIVGWLSSGGLRTIALHDLLWTAAYLFFVWHRSLNPEIFQQEKYMDFAFFNMLARTETMPPPDPWMSGRPINYYYFGYLAFANLARLIPLPAPISYNLCVATIGGLAFSQCTAVAWQLAGRLGLGLLGGAMCVLLGNIDGFLQLLSAGTLRSLNYWRSTRVIDGDNTINEFPFFSTLHGDLHPHFMVMPMTFLLLAILLDERIFPPRAADQPRGGLRHGRFLLVAFVFGAMVATSTWEVPVGALTIALLAGRWQPLRPLFTRARVELLLSVGSVLFAGLFVLFYPSYAGVRLESEGAHFKLARTSLAQFLTVNSFLLFAPATLILTRAWALLPGSAEWRQLLVAAAALLLVISTLAGNAVLPLLAVLALGAVFVAYAGEEDGERGGYLLALAGIAALLACEIVYIKDSYGERLYRMNTVFKFYFQAWLLLSVAAPWCLGRLLEQRWAWAAVPKVLKGITGVFVFATACYPIGLTLDRMGRSPTLDGNQYLQQPEFKADLDAIEWLRNNVSGMPVILEATGNPYSYFARISSNTGFPTVLGWANHEGLWRQHDAEVSARARDVEQIYNSPSLDAVRPLLAKYDVRFIVVGDLERKHYRAEGLRKFESLRPAYRSDGTTVYIYGVVAGSG